VSPELSVIIPTKNEARNLPRALASLAESAIAFEVVVVDASSEDGTADMAELRGATVIRGASSSRAGQMNAGAARAKAPSLLFLHADTIVPAGALDAVVRALRNDNSAPAGGAFLRRFDSPSLLLRATAWLAGLRSRYLGLFLGDQGIFVRRDVFEKLKGFDESLPRCEDLDFSRRLRREGRTVTLRPPVLSSARRFEERGPFRTTLSDAACAWRYFRSLH
jgi:rSAM/selenodomain-associated transferase 2